MKKKLIRIILILIAICVAIFFRIVDYAFDFAIAYVQKYHQEKQEKAHIENVQKERHEQEKQKRIERQRQIENKEVKKVYININKPSELSFKSKEEIYNLRKKYVSQSIFNLPNYEPSEEVFGQIESGKPWVSMKQCKYKDTYLADVQGSSEESRYINNPELLVGVDYAFYDSYCGERRTEEIPYSTPINMIYDVEKNTVEATFVSLPFCNQENKTWYAFKGLNARDLGYKYAYIDKEQSTFDVNFAEETNASNSIVEFQDFIHVGGSCGHESGCNNVSPNQPPLNFYYSCEDFKGYNENRIIYIKLWKDMPNSPADKADITQIIRFKRI